MIRTVTHTMQVQSPTTRLQTTAREFEAAFLAQMLTAAGAGKPMAEFGGGVGESQLSSFLLDAQAQQIAKRGGVGLAETIIRHYAQR